MAFEIAGWLMKLRSAAADMLPASATAQKSL
jgi:hypothetical protein